MNTHIALVKKWLGNPESVTVEELNANAESASAAAAAFGVVGDAAWSASYAAGARAEAAAAADAYIAAYATAARADVVGWVKEYEELTDGK